MLAVGGLGDALLLAHGDEELERQEVKTQFGFHVIKLEDKIDQPLPTFEQAKPQLQQVLMAEAYAKAVKAGREKVGVELLDDSLKLPEVK